jgi:ferredoxin
MIFNINPSTCSKCHLCTEICPADIIGKNTDALFISSPNGHWYTFMATHALGLGATVIGFIPPAIIRDKKLRALFQIPKVFDVIASLILGYPKYNFKRAIIGPKLNMH